ncbi:SsgA family sporulation/cell division regulator [Streptomyces sp. NBC_00271]|uniref:SsgA family sporulation/cell division regulator n=1 Tax=Streptomyces sp. NBC_00271 TaxID=2975697 RepID=UPI002E2C85BE|nr:SsgA family sporulation/cell division regulator [Streptomyces sp. NBC_00271]
MVGPQHPGMNIGPSDPDCPDLHLTLWLHVSQQETLPVEARFHYDRANPFAVSVIFSNAAGGAVTWVLSRELLMAGLLRPSGEGDVRIWPPCRRHGGTNLHVLLLGRTGAALLDVAILPVRAWLADTFALVPVDTEAQSIDWDSSFERVLHRRYW